MARYSKKSFLSLGLFLLLFLTSLRIANLTISSTLNGKSTVIKHLFEESLGLDTSFRKIDFSLFSGILFRDFSVQRDGQRLAFVKELRAYPDYAQLFKKRLAIVKILASDCAVSIEIIRHKEFLLSKIASLSRTQKDKSPSPSLFGTSNFNLFIRNLKLFLGSMEANKGFLLINSDITTRAENLTSKTSFDFRNCSFNRSVFKDALFYGFSDKVTLGLQLAFMRNDLLVNNFSLSCDNIKINGAGIVYDFKRQPAIDIKLITAPLNLREIVKLKSKIAINGLLNIVANIKGGAQTLLLQSEMLMPRVEFSLPKSPAVKVSNVFCSFHLKNNEFIVKELSFLVNYSFPVFISGKIVNFSQPELYLTLESNKSFPGEAASEEIRNLVAKVKSRLEDGCLAGKAELSLSSTKILPHYKSTREIGIQFDNFRFAYDKDTGAQSRKHHNLDLAAQDLFFKNRETVNNEVKNVQNLELHDFNGKFLLYPEEGIKSQISCSGYNGAFQGRGELSLTGRSKNDYFILKFSDLSVSDLKAIYPVTSDISGVLSGWIYFKNSPAAFLDGAVVIRDAQISRFDMLNNIGDFLSIPSIKELKDILIFAAFRAMDSGVSVKKFNLHNDSLNLDAILDINNQKWVSGRVLLTVSKSILKESFVFRVLLSMAREANEKIDFDFKVSGFAQSLRLELMEGEFRSKLMKRLGVGTRSQIENEVNKALNYFREKGQH